MNSSAPDGRRIHLTTLSVSASSWITPEELARAVGISHASLIRIVRLGLLEPAVEDPLEFPATTIARLRRMLRLRRDLGVDLSVATVMAGLVERLEQLEAELSRLRSGG